MQRRLMLLQAIDTAAAAANAITYRIKQLTSSTAEDISPLNDRVVSISVAIAQQL